MLYSSMSFVVLLHLSTAGAINTTNISTVNNSFRNNKKATTAEIPISRVELNGDASNKSSRFYDGRNFDETSNERDVDNGQTDAIITPTLWPTYAPTPLTKAPSTLIPTYSPTELPTKTPSPPTSSPSNTVTIQSSPPSTTPSSSVTSITEIAVIPSGTPSLEPSETALIPSPTPHPTIQPVTDELGFQATSFPTTSVWRKK